MSAIGCHAQHLASFVAGANVARVAADGVRSFPAAS